MYWRVQVSFPGSSWCDPAPITRRKISLNGQFLTNLISPAQGG